MEGQSISFTTRAVLAILAAYRLARLLSLEAGPGMVLARLRAWLGNRSVFLGTLFECPLCLGVWVAFALTPLVLLPLGEIILLPFAIAGGQCILQLVTDHDLDASDQAQEI
jgi:hypothetical protein